MHSSLSRRNLRQLDAALDGPATRNRCLARRAENGVSLVVEVEDDADHYDGRDSGPGFGKVAYCAGPSARLRLDLKELGVR